MCNSLEQIDLENNDIENEDNLYFLSSLDKLKSINLKGNPIKNYKDKLKELIPSLESIDEELKLHEIEEAIISFEPDFQNSSSANASHSTNENSSEFSNEQSKTKTNFYSNASSAIKKENMEEDKNILNNKEINFSQTMTNFKINRNKLAPLNPIIMKKEEDSNIKDLRESIQIHHNTKDKIPLTTMNKDNKDHKLANEPKTTLLNVNNKPTTSGMTMTHKPTKNSFLSSNVTVKKKLEKVVVNKGPVKSSLGIFTQGQRKIDFPVSTKKK